jgi:hypothetical protein
MVTPNSWGSLREYNTCHDPKTGKFSNKGAGANCDGAAGELPERIQQAMVRALTLGEKYGRREVFGALQSDNVLMPLDGRFDPFERMFLTRQAVGSSGDDWKYVDGIYPLVDVAYREYGPERFNTALDQNLILGTTYQVSLPQTQAALLRDSFHTHPMDNGPSPGDFGTFLAHGERMRIVTPNGQWYEFKAGPRIPAVGDRDHGLARALADEAAAMFREGEQTYAADLKAAIGMAGQPGGTAVVKPEQENAMYRVFDQKITVPTWKTLAAKYPNLFTFSQGKLR